MVIGIPILGDDYIHVRVRSPTIFRFIRTVPIHGASGYQARRGVLKSSTVNDVWKTQSVLIPKEEYDTKKTVSVLSEYFGEDKAKRIQKMKPRKE